MDIKPCKIFRFFLKHTLYTDIGYTNQLESRKTGVRRLQTNRANVRLRRGLCDGMGTGVEMTNRFIGKKKKTRRL